MAKNLHPKILELRKKVGYQPIYEFLPNRKKYDAIPVATRMPEVSAKEEAEKPRLIKQYFCIWGVPDDYGTRPIKGCFTKSLNERGPSTSATNKIVVLNQHSQKEPLCIPNILKEDEIGLYGEYEPDEGIVSNDELIIRVRKKTINQGSYGFNFVWPKMEWNEKDECIDMFECELFEVSPVTLGSQGGTFVVRNKNGKLEDSFLEEDTESLIRQIPRKLQLEARSIIQRHKSLSKLQPDEQGKKPLKKRKPKQRGIDYNSISENLNF